MKTVGPSGEFRGTHLFAHLGRWIVRHPWYPIVFWVVLLLVTAPFLSHLGSVTTNSVTALPSNSPSAKANAELARLFPSDACGSATILLFYGPDLTDANAQGVVMNVTRAIAADRSLVLVSDVSSVYTAYAGYLAGEAALAGGVLVPGLPAFNTTAALLWSAPTGFTLEWRALVANGTPTGQASALAYAAVNGTLNGTTAPYFDAFYAAFNGTAPGPDCTGTANGTTVTACADGAARAGEGPLVAGLPATERGLASVALADLAIENSTAWPSVEAAATSALAPQAGLPASFLERVLGAFPGGVVSAPASSTWANATVAASTLATEPLPVPAAIATQYVNPSGTASIVNVAFSVADDYTNASGGQPVYADLGKIDTLVPPIVSAHDGSGTIEYVQTGGPALDLLTNTSVNASIALVLPLTVGLLLGITMIYFRSPITPLVTFAALAIALVLALGGTILVGTWVTHVDTTSITLEEVFVLGVGTDYSIFLTARYREELMAGRSPDDAIVESLSWAGQSVATSGSTAIIATLALAFSGVALLSQWGSVLSLAILITLLLSLTMIPALLKLVGPRIFWPTTRDRFRRHAERTAQRLREESTYFYRVGRATERRPWTVIGLVVLVSVPLVAIAVTTPLSYDFYAQLPSGQPATNGLAELGSQFGDGFAVPSFALVTFASPLVVGTTPNATEFTDVAALTARAGATDGIASVRSPVGADGAPLATWLNLSALPPAVQTGLLGALGAFVGTDQRTVLLDLVPNATGLSETAVHAVDSVESSFSAYAATHPGIVTVAYGGGAPTIRDLAGQTATATDLLLVAVTIGLVVVLLAVLRSWIIALMAVATIGLSISWAWALTYLLFQQLFGFPIFFYVLTLLIMLVLGLGIDYNIFVLTRVREERLRGRASGEAAVEAVGRTGGIITAAAVILASAFAALLVGSFTLIRAIGISVAIAVVLDAMVVRTYLVPATLHILGDRVWSLSGRRGRGPDAPPP